MFDIFMRSSKECRRWVPLVFCLIFMAGTRDIQEEENPVVRLKIAELKSGLKLRYTLSLPSGYSPDRTYPLVLALHQGGSVTPFYGLEFLTALVQPALEELDAIIAAPDCPDSGWTSPLSEEAVLELILLCMETYRVDPGRVAVLGFGRGGLGAWYLAGRHPDIFSAAIPVAAPADAEATPQVDNVPLFIIHGENDEVFPPDEVMKLYQKQKGAGADVQFVIVEKTSHYELSRYITPLKATIPWIKRVWEGR
jgi:predicted peptidase